MKYKGLTDTLIALTHSGLGPGDHRLKDTTFVHKLRKISLCALILIIATLVFAGLNLAFGSTFLFAVFTAASLLCAGNLLFLRKTGNTAVSSHILAVIFTFLVIVSCSKSGGIRSPGIIWLLLLPVGAGFAISFRSSFLYGMVSVFIILVFYFLHTINVYFVSVIPDEHYDLYFILQFLALLIVIVIVVFDFLAVHEKTINALHMSEKKFREISKQEEKASRIKSEFLANMSHEIRTPMNGIIAMMHMLLDTSLNEEQKKYSRVVYNSANALLTIINDILDFSKIEAGMLEFDMRDFDLRVALEDMNTMFQMQAEQKNIDYACTIETETPTRLHGDPGRIRQILNNLTGNAIKFTDAGEVVLRISLESEDNDSAVIRFSVIDTGIGISPEKIPALFDSFTQADASTTRMYGGTGLGLSISKMLVQKMSGQIGVESEELLGSTFWFSVPLKKQPTAISPAEELSTCIEEKKALIVSDNTTSREILKQQLEQLKLQVSESDKPEHALDLLINHAHKNEPFHAAMVDMQMKGLNPESLAERIKVNPLTSNVALVLLTSVGEKGDARKFEKAGFSGYLSKPVDKDLLGDCIKAIMGGKKENKASLVTRHSIAESRKHSTTILVVEDNETNLIVAKELLTKLGYKTHTAKNGRQAVEKFKGKSYSLVLMDCQMPVMDGLEATKEIRKFEKNKYRTPIVAMTANALIGDREKCLESGMDDYITKPINPDELSQIINRNLAGRIGFKVELTKKDAPDAKPLPDIGQDAIVFDRDEMMKRFGGDSEVVKIVVDSFIDESPGVIEKIKEAALAKNGEALETLSHALKGSSANVNALLLKNAALNMEEKAKQKDFSRVESIALNIEKEFNKFLEESS